MEEILFLIYLFRNKASGILDLPTPTRISYFWNFGSLLGVFLISQIITGVFLGLHFCRDVRLAFDSIVHICRDGNWGWALRMIHSNGASMFFICIYLHIGRNLYYGSFFLKGVWLSGIIIFSCSMGSAFLGYVLPWGQISFWGATVITNLISTIPLLGKDIVEWVWGGFSVRGPTLSRFFVFHFLLPFVIVVFVIGHIFFLHISGSSNPVGASMDHDKISFHPTFTSKDVIGVTLFIIFLWTLILLNSNIFIDHDNFKLANPLVTPPHIQPEWYFLFAYSILRSIPNKLGGVIGLVICIVRLFFLPLFTNLPKFKGIMFYPINKFFFSIFCLNFFLLTWMGACPVEAPFILISQICSVIYFILLFGPIFYNKLWDRLLIPMEK